MKNKKTLHLALLAIFTALIVLLSFFGYIQIGPLSITIVMIPVVIGAILMGPAAGAYFGAIFGLTSFFRCFGLEAFGTALLTVNPFFTFIVCLVPRVLMGWLVGVIFKGLQKIDRTKFLSYAISSLCGALLNTVLFMTALILFFGNSSVILDLQGAMPLFEFLVAFVGLNGLIEAIVCFVLGTTISKVLSVAWKSIGYTQ